MRTFYFIAIALLFWNCQPKVQNDHETLASIFNSKHIEVEIDYGSSVGGYNYVYEINKSNSEYTISAKESGKSNRLDYSQLDNLKTFAEFKLQKPIELNCTDTFFMLLSNGKKSVKISSACGNFDNFRKVIVILAAEDLNKLE